MNLTTRYLGLTLKHPFMPGASPLVDDLSTVRQLEDAGASAIVLHSLFEEQVAQEQVALHRYTDFHRDAFAEAGSFFPEPEAFRLGPEPYLEQLRKIKRAVAVPVIASLNGTTNGGWLDYARLMEQAGADALELNVYQLAADPTLSAAQLEHRVIEMVRTVKASVRIPIAVKLSPFFTSLSHFAAQLCAAGADGLVLFNRFYQPDIDVNALEVRRTLHLSDSSELPLRLRWLAILSSQVPASLAATGGLHEPLDAVRALMAGAHAVQLVSALLRHGPRHLTTILRGVEAWMAEKEYPSIDALRGSMSLKTCPDPSAYERANYMLMLQGWTPTDSERKKRARESLEALDGDVARAFGPVTLQKHGPRGARRSVACVTDESTGLEYVLVPGGSFSPGLDEEKWALLVELAAAHRAPPKPYGAASSASFAKGPGKTIKTEPFWIARFPVTARVKGIEEVLSKDTFARNVREEPLKQNPKRFLPLSIEEVAASEERFGWRMPSVMELEWAISAGARSVFYWGDGLDYEEINRAATKHPLLRLEDVADGEWPGTTAFGLRSAVAIPQWCCSPSPEGLRCYVRGGAGFCAPWQGCGEFLWMVNLMVAPIDALEPHDTMHALRPVLTLR